MIPFERLGSMALACLLLAACGSPRQAPASLEPADSASAGETVLDDMVDTMDRAREVEDVTRQHKEALDRAMEQAERGDP